MDPRLRADIKESIVSLLQFLSSDNLQHWLSMCKQVLLASKAEADKPLAKKEAKGIKVYVSDSKQRLAAEMSCLVDSLLLFQVPK